MLPSWYRIFLLFCSSLWLILSNRSAREHDLADLPCVIRLSNASITASTNAVLPLKKDRKTRLMSSNICCWLTAFLIMERTYRFDLSKASAVLLLQSRWSRWWDEPREFGIVSSTSRFLAAVSVIRASTFAHNIDGVTFSV